MKILAETIKKNGFVCRKVYRRGDLAIYSQTNEIPPNRVWFELWVIRQRPEGLFMGKRYPASERAPGSEDWGRYGWTFRTMELALQKMESLVSQLTLTPA